MEEKIINMNQFLGAAQGDQEHMLGKFLYFSLANLLVDKDELSSLCVHEKSCPRDGQHRTGASGRWLGAPDRQSCLSSSQKYGSRPRL